MCRFALHRSTKKPHSCSCDSSFLPDSFAGARTISITAWRSSLGNMLGTYNYGPM